MQAIFEEVARIIDSGLNSVINNPSIVLLNIIALFVCLDDFCKIYNSSIKEKMLPLGRKRNREGYLSLSEILFNPSFV